MQSGTKSPLSTPAVLKSTTLTGRSVTMQGVISRIGVTNTQEVEICRLTNVPYGSTLVRSNLLAGGPSNKYQIHG